MDTVIGWALKLLKVTPEQLVGYITNDEVTIKKPKIICTFHEMGLDDIRRVALTDDEIISYLDDDSEYFDLHFFTIPAHPIWRKKPDKWLDYHVRYTVERTETELHVDINIRYKRISL